MNSFNEHGQLRWRTPVVGTPLSAQFTGDGNLLFVTQLGADRRCWTRRPARRSSPSVRADPGRRPSTEGANVRIPPDDQGLERLLLRRTRLPGREHAGDRPRHRPVLRHALAPRRARSAELVAMQLHRRRRPAISAGLVQRRAARRQRVEPGPVRRRHDASTPTTTRARCGRSMPTTGEPQWSYDLGYAAAGSPSSSADGLIIPAGADRRVTCWPCEDKGDHAELVWERKDLVCSSASRRRPAASTGYTVVREGDAGLGAAHLRHRDRRDARPGHPARARNGLHGRHARSGPDGEVLTPTLIGELFVLR